jgi:hypothetical protein
MWEQLLLRTPTDTAAQVCRAVLASMQHDVQAPHHAPGQAPPSGAQRTGTTTSSGAHQGSLEAQQAATAAALSGPDHVANACDLALALSVLGARPGALSQRYAMLSAAASAWPAHPVGVLALMLLEDAVLGPGEAVTIPSGCPHAYICGAWCGGGWRRMQRLVRTMQAYCQHCWLHGPHQSARKRVI